MGLTERIYLIKEAKAWLRKPRGPGHFVTIVPDMEDSSEVLAYNLFVVYEHNPEALGRILFDAGGYWIYDGDLLTIGEQEQIARFIINYQEKF
jgi:hypothetical protein